MKEFVVKPMLKELWYDKDGVEWEITLFNTGEYEARPTKPVGSGNAYVSVPFIPQPHMPIKVPRQPIPQRQKISIKELLERNKKC